MLTLLYQFQKAHTLYLNRLRQKTELEKALVWPCRGSLGSQWREVSIMTPDLSDLRDECGGASFSLLPVRGALMHRRKLSESKVSWVKSHPGLQVPLGSKHTFGDLALNTTSWKVSGPLVLGISDITGLTCPSESRDSLTRQTVKKHSYATAYPSKHQRWRRLQHPAWTDLISL